MKLFLAAIDGLNKWSGIVAGWFAVLLVLVTCQQVIAHSFFHSSSVGIQELEWYLFGALFLLSTGYTLQVENHVRVDIFYGRLSPKKKSIVDISGIVLFLLPTCFVVCYFGFLFAYDSATSYQNPRPMDYFSANWFQIESSMYELSAKVEKVLRTYILIGEISNDGGGLEARWIIKSFIPLGFLFLGLQGISLLIKNIQVLMGLRDSMPEMKLN